MMRRVFILSFSLLMVVAARGQQKSDTVIVSLAKTSKVIFTIQDRSDLEILKHYNFQDLFHDILTRIEKSDSASAPVAENQKDSVNTPPSEEAWTSEKSEYGNSNNDPDSNRDDSHRDDSEENDEEWQHKIEKRRGRIGRTWQSFNFDLGTNNYVTDGKFPDNNNALYSVRPWGSWYLAGSSIQRTRVGRNLFFEWGLGLSVYNFKFQNDNIVMQKDDSGVQFVADTRDVNFRKSKLTATYVNASFVPVLDLGGRSRKSRMWDGYGSSFRIGLGPYIGYRVGSHSKLVYSENGNREKEKQRDNFYLNNFRYGARLQLGFYGTDLFFNYDLNELFVSGKGPKLNAFSFGVIF